MKISVITVCLNAEKYIEQLLNSVAEQDWADVEHIIVDGCSCDNTISIVKSYAESNSKLSWTSCPDAGISDAMNKGLSLSSGEVVAFLHSDDFYVDSEVLGRVAKIFAAQPQIEWLTGGVHYVNEIGHIIKSYPTRHWSYQRLLRGNILFHPATFIRRRVLESVGGFDTRLRYTMDYDLWLRLGRLSAPYLLNSFLASFRVHPESTSVRDVDDSFKEEFQVRCRYLQGKPLQKTLHFIYFWLKFLPNRVSMRYVDAR
jgi:glycosyltransferase involved in cell wall biosynthesis